jgi:hypothetical protein
LGKREQLNPIGRWPCFASLSFNVAIGNVILFFFRLLFIDGSIGGIKKGILL